MFYSENLVFLQAGRSSVRKKDLSKSRRSFEAVGGIHY